MKVLVIDNYDSFTFNLVQALFELGDGVEVEVWRNDAIDLAGLRARRPDRLLLSPGPRRPEDAGITLDAIRALTGTLPILGVCLGHQAIGQAFGGKVVRARRIAHGEASLAAHEGRGLFAGLGSPMQVGRYHSLAVEDATLPAALRVTARTEDGEVMALTHRGHPTAGVQFHPESVLTPEGKTVLANFLEGRM